MPVDPLKRIYETPAIKKGTNEGLPSRKKPKHQKKREQKRESGKIDIKV
jgi:hypothetical protein